MNLLLAEIAQREVHQNFHGDTDTAMGNLQPLAELFDAIPEVTLQSLNTDWSGAFVYHCTELAGIGLPLKYPDPRVRASFACVEGWEDYAKLPKIGLWRRCELLPDVGDLVIFAYVEGRAPRMGVVLAVDEEAGTMDVAVGNQRNHSAIIEHPLYQNLRGYIRLEQ